MPRSLRHAWVLSCLALSVLAVSACSLLTNLSNLQGNADAADAGDATTGVADAGGDALDATQASDVTDAGTTGDGSIRVLSSAIASGAFGITTDQTHVYVSNHLTDMVYVIDKGGATPSPARALGTAAGSEIRELFVYQGSVVGFSPSTCWSYAFSADAAPQCETTADGGLPSPVSMAAYDSNAFFITGPNNGGGFSYQVKAALAVPGTPSYLGGEFLNANALAVSDTSIFVAWEDRTIRRTDANGGAADTIVNADSDILQMIVSGSSLYFATGTGSLISISTTAVADAGTPTTTVLTGLPLVTRFAEDATFIYFTSSDDGSVLAVNKTSSQMTTIAEGQATPTGIAVDESGIYWTNEGDGTVMFAPPL